MKVWALPPKQCMFLRVPPILLLDFAKCSTENALKSKRPLLAPFSSLPQSLCAASNGAHLLGLKFSATCSDQPEQATFTLVIFSLIRACSERTRAADIS